MNRRAAAHGIGAFIIIAPLAWGLMPIPFWSAAAFVLIIGAFVCALAASRRKNSVEPRPDDRSNIVSSETTLAYRLILLLLALILIIHYVPWPIEVLRVINPSRADWAATLEPDQRWVRPAINAYGARQSFLLYAAALACAVIGYFTAGDFKSRRRLLLYAAISGLTTAIAALWLERYHPDFIGGRIEGPIRRSNAYASWQAMTLFAGLGLVASGITARRSSRYPQRYSRALVIINVAVGAPAVIGGLALMMLSGSRFGLVSLIASGLLFLWLMFAGRNPETRKWRQLPIIALCFFLAGVLLMPHILSDRFEFAFRNQSEAAVGRFAAWRDSLEIWKAFPLFGVGPGGFRHAFPHFQTIGLLGTYNNPHQEPIALLTELGLFGIAPAILAILLIVRRLSRLRATQSSTDYAQTAGLLAALAMPVLHSFGDFPLRTPSSAFIFCILLGVALRQADSIPEPTDSDSRSCSFIRWFRNSLDRRTIRLATRFATLVLVIVALRFSLIVLIANPWVEWIPGVAKREMNPNTPDPLTLARCVYRSSIDPLDGDAFALLARAHFTAARTTTNSAAAESELAQARIAAESGLRFSPTHRELHHLRGGILLRLGEYDAGIRSIDNQVWLTPADPSLTSACGRMLAIQYRNAPNSLPSLLTAFRLAAIADPRQYVVQTLNALIAGGIPKRYWDDVFSATPMARAIYADALDRLGLPAAAMAIIETKTGETGVALVAEITDEQIRLNLWLLKTRLLIKTGRAGDELSKTLNTVYYLHTDLQLETYFTGLTSSFNSLSAQQTLDALNPLKDSNVRHPPKGMMWIIAQAYIRSGNEASGYDIIDELHSINPELRTARALVVWHFTRRHPDTALDVLNSTFSAYGASLSDGERLYIYEQRARALLLMKQPEAARSELEQALRVIETNPKLQSSRSRINTMISETIR